MDSQIIHQKSSLEPSQQKTRIALMFFTLKYLVPLEAIIFAATLECS